MAMTESEKREQALELKREQNRRYRAANPEKQNPCAKRIKLNGAERTEHDKKRKPEHHIKEYPAIQMPPHTYT